MISNKEFLYQLRKEIICETRKTIREERYKKNPNPSFYINWAEHQKGQIRGILEDMRQVGNGLKIIDVELLWDLEHYYQQNISIVLNTFLEKYKNIEINEADKSKIQNLIESRSISRYRYYDSIFSAIKVIKKFHELILTDDTYENRRKAYFNALTIVNEGRNDEVFPQFPSTRISTYRTLSTILRAYYFDEEKRDSVIREIKYYFDKNANGEDYKNSTNIRKISSKKTKFEKEQYEKFSKIFKINIRSRE